MANTLRATSGGIARSQMSSLLSTRWMTPPEYSTIGTSPKPKRCATGYAVWYIRPVAMSTSIPLSCAFFSTAFV